MTEKRWSLQNAFSSCAPFLHWCARRRHEALRLVALRELPQHASNPLKDNCYSAPVMTPAMQEAVTVAMEEIGTKLKAVMDEHGVAIVTGVLPPEDVAQSESLFQADLDDLVDNTGLVGGAEDAYAEYRQQGPRALPLPTAKRISRGNGFLLSYCLPHGSFAWYLRRHANVDKVFRVLHAAELEESAPEKRSLVSSLDVTFFSPATEPTRTTADFSAHCDQNWHDVRGDLAAKPSFQGVVYVWPTGEETSTTVVWPGSHRSVWKTMMEDSSFMDCGKSGFHYCEIRDMDDKAKAETLGLGWAANCQRCVVPAGAMLLWNSRTVHTGWSGGPRLAQAVCLEPSSRRSCEARVGKMRLAALGLPSTHWASQGMQHDMAEREVGYLEGYKKNVGFEKIDPLPREGAWDHDLPLRHAIHPQGLHKGADLEDLLEIARVKFDLTCIWKPTDVDDFDWLEAMVAPDILPYL